MGVHMSMCARIRVREGAHRTIEERTGKEDKETKRERAGKANERVG